MSNQICKHWKTQIVTIAIAVTGLNLIAEPAKSAVLALKDDNAIAAIDPDFSNNPVNTGVLFWTVDDVNHLFQNQFWYRTGNTGGENTLNSLNLTNVSQPTQNKVSLAYTGNNFEIGIDFTLKGGATGSGVSSLLENITIKNTGSSLLDFHFFNYTDFDLNETDDDTATINKNGARTSDSSILAREVVTPSNRYQVSPTFDILNGLSDDKPTNLNNFSGPNTGDNAYAFQWDFALGSQEVFSISTTKSISPVTVPEPTTILGVLSFGSLMLGKRSRWLNRDKKAQKIQ
jgi:hypothetical protein